MAIRLSDSLAKITGETSADDRFVNWLWLTLKTRPFAEDPGEFNAPSMRDRMAEIISKTPGLMDYINSEKRLMLVDGRYLSWITDSKRQHIWIKNRILHINQTFPKELFSLLSNRELSILAIDRLDNFSMQKNQLVADLHSSWEQQKKEDRAFDWLQEEDEEKKCGLAWSFLCKRATEPLLIGNKFESLDDLLSYFYTVKPSKELIEILIKTVKSRWSQNKYREKQTGKKQYNFILSENAIKSLDKLAKKHNLKRTQILEILLHMENEKNNYIPERIKILANS